MGIARIRRLAATRRSGGTPRRERPEPILCSGCKVPLAASEGTGLCARCAVTAYRLATTGSPNRRPINQPKRAARRAKAQKGSPS